MSRHGVFAASIVTLAHVCAMSAYAGGVSAPTPGLVSGIDLQFVDHSVRPQDDPYRYLNGKWLDSFELPPDEGDYGAFTIIDDMTQQQLRGIVDGLARSGAFAPAVGTDPEIQKITDLYASFMDEPRLQTLGLKPLESDFAAIDAMSDKNQIPALIAHLNRIGAGAPFDFYVSQDAKNSTQYAVILHQSGLGMPDRDYYLSDDAKLKQTCAKYLAHVGTMLAMLGDENSKAHAAAILELETAMAQIQWTPVENRDPIKSYNRTATADLPKLMTGYDWPLYLRDAGVAGKADSVIVTQPSYFAELGKVIATTPLPVWKSYFKWQVLSAAAPFLSKPFVDARFAFTGTVLSDIPQNKARWKRGLELLDEAMGEALGKRYVARYFPPQSKARMQALVLNLISAYRRDLDTLDWMSPQTKAGAQAKLSKLVTKIGYPPVWRDYGALRISRDDLWGNVMRAKEFEFQHDLDELGKPIDRTEWGLSPQTVNAYYYPPSNEIVFPAAILQPPYFNALADDAVNYGAIGALIGHEISHALDDVGSQYDSDGNLHDWFTPTDHDRFAAKTRALIDQYNHYDTVPNYHVNGELTLGENIGDNSGLEIAYKAYRQSLAGKPAAIIEGMSGDERFYFGWVQAWRGKVRTAEAIRRIKIDPHSPPAVRGKAALSNQAGYYRAFGVNKDDKMYLPPERRVHIW
jgi:putative endopeptidase